MQLAGAPVAAVLMVEVVGVTSMALKEVASLILRTETKNVVVLTGAGISVSSGIPGKSACFGFFSALPYLCPT